MMQGAAPRSWKEAFALAVQQEDEARRVKRRMALLERQDEDFRDKRDEEKDREEREEWHAKIEAAASQAIEAFRSRLDDYDARTVDALIKNGEAMDRIDERLKDMRDRATVLPDGRRVFKTEDGERVFDEHGASVSSGTIDPDMIDDRKVRWEAFHAAQTERQSLAADREKLLEYQSKLDEARASIDKGEITNGELDDLSDRLKADMPNAMLRASENAGPGRDVAGIVPSDAIQQRAGTQFAPM